MTLLPRRISIFGASTLKAFTEGILGEGFREHGISTEMRSVAEFEAAGNEPVLLQIHGSPESEAHDRALFAFAELRLSEARSPTIILLHRPDEIEGKFSREFARWRYSSSAKAAFVLLGTYFVDAPYLQATGLPIEVVSHGFFVSDQSLQENPVVVGAHTGWGEMRSLRHAAQLLAAVFTRSENLPIVGYLGGGPRRELELRRIDDILVDAGLRAFELVQVSQLSFPIQLASHPRIIISHEGAPPPGLGLTFNLQLYHLNGAVRRGESSGSLHRGVSVPVILEMNGAEALEDLRVVKVPYDNSLEAGEADWGAAAEEIDLLLDFQVN